MTKGELIKALQAAPFEDDAVVAIGHYYDFDIIVRSDSQLAIGNICVFDENELTITLIPDDYTQAVVNFKNL
jgi:hypothetical protein